MHLFVDISSHGFGHLAITAPILNALAEIAPKLRLTVRSTLPPAKLAQRIRPAFAHIAQASDFGYVMRDALSIDHEATARAYRVAHADWPARVAVEARFLAALQPDAVLTSVSYLPLAGAAACPVPVPAVAVCSLNWADLFAHFFGQHSWAAPIHAEMLAAYRSARQFIRITPAMPMDDLGNARTVGSIAERGRRHDLGLPGGRAVLVALGGIDHHLPVDHWPRLPGVRWLVAGHWRSTHPDAIAYESFGLPFTDLICSADAVITKPGYGTFAEAACNGIPVIYQRRDDWPEQDCLIAWLQNNARCREVDPDCLVSGDLSQPLAQLWKQAMPPCPPCCGARETAEFVARLPG